MPGSAQPKSLTWNDWRTILKCSPVNKICNAPRYFEIFADIPFDCKLNARPTYACRANLFELILDWFMCRWGVSPTLSCHKYYYRVPLTVFLGRAKVFLDEKSNQHFPETRRNRLSLWREITNLADAALDYYLLLTLDYLLRTYQWFTKFMNWGTTFPF